MYPRGLPQMRQRLTFLVEYLGFFCAFTIIDFFAMVSSLYLLNGTPNFVSKLFAS